jgi:hypothetical protein
MPTRKKTTAVEAALPPADNAPAAKPKKAAAPRKPAAKPAAPKAEKSPAATHKAPAKRAAAPKAQPASFDVEAHRAEIEREAYFLWERRGHAHGSSNEDWWTAVELVRARHAK